MSSGVWDFGPATYKTCSRCERIKKLALKRWPPHFGEGPAFGELRDWIRDQVG